MKQRRKPDHMRNSISAREVIELLERLEAARKSIAHDTATFHHWLGLSDLLASTWTDFTAAGGISANDFERFLTGGLKPSRPLHRKKHLRLVVSRDRTPIKRRRLGQPPSESA